MLMESEHSMAREDRDGSGVEMGFMAMSPLIFPDSFLQPEKMKTIGQQNQRFP
jgi:hypothetical protein